MTTATAPVQDTPERVLARKTLDALLQQVRALEQFLGVEPKIQAVCPHCERRWNKRVA